MQPDLQKALQLLSSEPDNADALAALAAAAEGGGNGHSDPAASRALGESRRAHRERGDFELVVRLFDLELGWEKDMARRAELYVEKGRVLLDELLLERDAEAAFQRALESQPGDEAAEDAMAQLALVRDNWKKIVQKYLEEAKASTDKQLTTGLYVSVAELFWKREPEATEVEEYLRKALDTDPKNRKAAVYLDRLLRRTERWTELSELIEKRLDQPSLGITKEDRASQLVALADLQRDRLRRPDLAVTTMQKVLAADPGHTRALAVVTDALTQDGDWSALVKVLEAAAKARQRDNDASVRILSSLGEVLYNRLGNPEAAEQQYARIRKIEPANAAMLDFYRNFHIERNEGAKLLAVLSQAQKVETDAKKRLHLGVEMAQIAEAAAGTADKAIDIWKGILRSEPGSIEAVAALKRLFAGAQKWNGLLELLKEQVEHIPLPSEPGPERDAAIDKRVALLLEVVAIYNDRLNVPQMVANTYNAILQLRPDHEGVLTSLAQKHEATGRWNDLINVLTRTAEVTHDVDKKASLLRRVASLWVERFGNHNQAVKPLEELYALKPGDAEAVVKLRDIYGKRRAWRQLLDLERKELERLDLHDASRRPRIVETAKMAIEKLGDPKEAIALWNLLLEQNPDDGEALGALASLYEREKRYPALVEVLRRQRHHVSDPKQQLVLLEKLGALAAEKLQSPSLAIEAYQEILRHQPNQPKALRLLRDLYVQARDFDGLERLYTDGGGSIEELCEMLLGVADKTDDTDLKRKLNLRVAAISLEKLRQPERAAKAYERLLIADPQNREAAEALVPLYRASEKWPRLLATYETLLEMAQARAARGSDGDRGSDELIHLYRELYQLSEQKLGNKGQAFLYCAQAYELRPDDAELASDLSRLADEADAHDELAVIWAAQLDKTPDGETKVERLRRLANLVLRKLGRAEEARGYYEKVVAEVPGDPQALDALEEIHINQGDHTALLRVYRQRLETAVDGAARSELLFKIAWIEEEQGGDLDAAAATYRQILDEDSRSARALKALERIYSAKQNHAGLAQVVSLQLDCAEGDSALEVELGHRLGTIHEEALSAPDSALPHYERAFAIDPAHRPTIKALERYLVDGNAAQVRVAGLLEPVYEKLEEPARQVESLKILLAASAASAAATGPAAGLDELDILRKLVSLSSRLGDVESAYDYACRIFEKLPGDENVRRELGELADVLDAQKDHAKRLAAAEERVKESDVSLARDLAWELGQLYEQRLRQPDDAEKAYRRVLERDERHEEAQRALERLYRDSGRLPELRGMLEQRAELAGGDEERRTVLFQLAQLDEDVLGDKAAAARTYQQILDIEPGSTRATTALERLLTAQQRWRDLDELYEKAIPHVDSSLERAELKAKRGDLYAARLDDPRTAVDLYEEAIAENPSDAAATAGLERLLRVPDQRLRSAKLLEPIYETAGEWGPLASVLLAQREKSEGRDAVDLLARIAGIAEDKLGDEAQAFDVWREAFRLDVADEELQRHMEQLAARLGRAGELAEAWEEGETLSDAGNLALRRDFLGRAGRLYEDVLADTTRARSVWRRLLDLDPTHLETARPAAEALARIYQDEEAWPQLIEVLRQQAAWMDGGADAGRSRTDYLRQVAVIQEDMLQDHAAAVATHRDILDAEPEDRHSLDSLERLHAAQKQWPELVEVLRRRFDLSSDATVRRDLSWRIAVNTEERLVPAGQHPDEAVAAYNAVLDERPDDVPALEALSRLYQSSDRNSDLLDMLERRLSLVLAEESPLDPVAAMEQRATLRIRVAQLLEGPLERGAQALERYREVLVEDPENEQARQGLERMLDNEDLRLLAAEVLEPIYEGRGETDRLVHLNELLAEHSPDTSDRIARLRGVATLRERSGDDQSAFEALSRAVRLAVSEPELPSLLGEIDRLAEASGGASLVPAQIALLREIGPDVLSQEVQEAIYFTVGAKARHLGDLATARDYYRRVLDTAPEHTAALDALESLYHEAHDYEALLETFTRRAELSGDDSDQKRHYLLAAARLCEEELGRPDDAMDSYRQILDLFPADHDAAQRLETLYDRLGRHSDLADLMERRLGFAEDLSDAVALRVRLGELYEKQLSDGTRAVENYRAALGGDPDHAGAIEALQRFLDDPDQRVEASEVLEPIFAARHDWKALIRIYEIRLTAVEEPAKRIPLTKRIARLYEEQLEDLDGAFRWYGRVFREDASDRASRDQLTRLANILGAHARLADVYEDYLKETFEETPASLDILRTLAALYDGRLNAPEKAKLCYLRLLANNPGDVQVFTLLENTLTRGQRWADLLQVYKDAADNAPDADRRKALLYKMCPILRDRLADHAGAIEAYRSILEIDDEDQVAAAALDQLYSQSERWHDLVELLGRRIDKLDGAERAEAKMRLGHLHEEKLEDLTAAVDCYEEVLSVDPGNEEAISALEQLITIDDVRLRIAQILEPVYRATAESDKLGDVLEAQLEFVDEKLRRVELLREIAGLQIRGRRLRQAFDALARAWSEEAQEGQDREEPIYDELLGLAQQLGLWNELVGALQKAIDGVFDDELVARVNGRIAEIQDARLGDATAAIVSWRKVVAIHDDDVAAWKALERLLGAQDRPTEMVEVLTRRAQLSPDVREQKALYYRAADLQERVLRQADEAVSTWKQVQSIDEDDRPALSALARLHRLRGNLRELAQVLARQIEILPTEEERLPIRFAMAEVHEESHDTFEAISAYKSTLDANPGDQHATEALLRLYEAEGMWPDLLETLDLAASLAVDAPERDAMRFRAAHVMEERQGEALGAVERYRQILDENPTHPGAREALSLLVRKDETREAAAAVLEPLYRATTEWTALVEVLELRLAHTNDPSERRMLLSSIAELHEVGLEDVPAAFRAWGRLLEEDANDGDVHAQLERLASRQVSASASWSELARLYEKRLESVLDPESQRQLSLKLASLYEERVGDTGKALGHYRKALDQGGDEAAALASLDRLLARDVANAEVASELADVLQREASVVEDVGAQADFWYRLGQLREVNMQGSADHLDLALSAYREALDRVPSHAGARAALENMLESGQHALLVIDLLEPLYETDGNHVRRLALAEARLRHVTSSGERASLLLRIAGMAEHDLGDLAVALDATARALVEAPEDLSLADEIERIARTAGLYAEAAGALERVLDAGVPTEAAREVGLRAARLYDILGDDTRAEVRYLAVLDVDPENSEALSALERMYRSQSSPSSLADILSRKAGVEPDAANKKALLSEVALLREGPLADEPGAVGAWKQVLEIDDGDIYALGALASLHESAGRYRDLVEVLEQQARFTVDVNELAPLKARIGGLYTERLGDLDHAVDAWREVLDLVPDSMPALAALEDLQTRRRDFAAVQDVLVRQLDAIQLVTEQVPVLRKLAHLISVELKNPDEAIGYLQRILDILPDDERSMLDIEAALEAQGRFYDLVDALRKHADLASAMGEREREIGLLVRSADIFEGKLENPTAASEILELILSRDPNNVKALASLAKIYEAGHDLEKCKEILERAASLASPGPEAAQVQFRLGRVEEERAGAGAGEKYFAKALSFDSAHAAAADALEVIARQKGDWARVAQLVAMRAQKAPAAEQKTLWLELAKIFGHKLGRPAEALGSLERARALAPADPAVLEPLAEGYFSSGRLGEALPIFLGLIDQTLQANKGRKTKELAKLHFRVAGIAEKAGDLARANEQYNAAYQIDPGHAPTLAALGRLYMDASDWEKARRMFRSLLLQNLDPTSGVRKADVYFALGEIHEKTNEAPKAVGMYERGLELEPSNEKLKEALARAKAAK